MPRLVRAQNVRAALMSVARSEPPLGMVHSHDAPLDKAAGVVETFPGDTHQLILVQVPHGGQRALALEKDGADPDCDG